MKIQVNGETVTTTAPTLEQLCVDMGFADGKIATAVNGDFIPEKMRKSTILADEDKIEIVSPRQGG